MCDHVGPMWLGIDDRIMCERCGLVWVDPQLYEALATKPIDIPTYLMMRYIVDRGYQIPQQAALN